MTIEVRWGTASHEGNARARNEDAVLADPPVFAVADGMGGHAAGEVASALAIAELGRFRGATALGPDSVLVALREANAQIHHQAEENEEYGGMGTTVVGVALVRDGAHDRLVAFNVGDSRLYRWREGTLVQLSEDHSVVGELVRAGTVSGEEARAHPDRNVVTRALGIDESVDIDTWALGPLPGDRYLLCSDGLVEEVDDAAISEHVSRDAPPQDVADALVETVLAGRARDNVSVLVLDVVGVEDDDPHGVDDDTNRNRAADVQDTQPRGDAATHRRAHDDVGVQITTPTRGGE